MRPLSLSLALLMMLALPGLVVADDAEQARLEELWKTGSLWQVGDNIPKVEAARKEIVAAGDAGLAFIFTKLNTTDGLEYRCIEAVFKGFGAKALPGLCERMGHEDVKVRRNVAAMLGVIDDKSVAPKMVEHLKKETDLRCRVGHLQTLARWKEPTALDPLIECTRTTQEQEPLAERLKVRIVPLLANYPGPKANKRLIELLDDDAYFIRDAARDVLKGSIDGQIRCQDEWFTEMNKMQKRGPVASRRLRGIVAVCAASAKLESSSVLGEALFHPDEALRSEAASFLAQFVKAQASAFGSRKDTESADFEDTRDKIEALIVRARKLLRAALSNESDPCALKYMEDALAALRDLTVKK